MSSGTLNLPATDATQLSCSSVKQMHILKHAILEDNVAIGEQFMYKHEQTIGYRQEQIGLH